jgi:hypothetical protein
MPTEGPIALEKKSVSQNKCARRALRQRHTREQHQPPPLPNPGSSLLFGIFPAALGGDSIQGGG